MMNNPAMTEFLKNPWLALEQALNETLSPGMALLDMGSRLRSKSIGKDAKEGAMENLHKDVSVS